MMENVKININSNGTTTLATAGKYCDRNIDVEVLVEGGGTGGVVEGQLLLTADGEEFLTVDNEQFAVAFQDRLVEVDNFPTSPNEEAVYKIVRSETDVQYGIPTSEAEVFRYTEETYAALYVRLTSQVLDFITYYGMIGYSYLGYKTVNNVFEIDESDTDYIYINKATNTMHAYLSGEWQSNSFTVVENKDSIPSTIGFYGCYGTTRKWVSLDDTTLLETQLTLLETQLNEKEDEITSLNTQIEEATAKTNFIDYATLEIVDGKISLSSINDKTITSFIIHPSVNVLGDDVFRNCDNLTSVVIPNSVTSIGAGAFRSCDSLTSIKIPNSVTLIDEDAFWGCTSLTSVVIPDSVTSIGNNAFRICTSLTSVVIPDSVTSIGECAFFDCPNLTSVVIGNGVTSIGGNAFSGCRRMTSITIPNSVTSIGLFAFSDCEGLTDITYNGTQAQWNSITFGTNWNANTGNYTIHCTDGDVTKS